MKKVLAGFGSADLGPVASNAATILDRISDAASVFAIPTYENEVNYRPAAQQWTVCTP